MGEAKVRKRAGTRNADNEASAEELAAMLRGESQSQAGTVTQADIPPNMEVYATMARAWEEMLKQFPAHTHPKVLEDAKWCFFNGIREAVNLCIYCAGQGKVEAAFDQISAECVAYEKEAEAVLKRRSLDAEPGDGPGAPTSH